MSMRGGIIGLAITILFFFVFSSSSSAILHDVSYDGRAITIDGERRVLLSGSIHYPRSTPEMWPDLIKKAKEGGLDTIETYVFWNSHEPQRRQYDFSDNLDLVRFLKTVQDAGLYAVLRIGPYVCAEWNYGGLPVWLHNMDGVEIRTDNNVFKNEMANFTTLIVDMMRKEKLFASQGGPIIIAQIENEYGNVKSIYGDAGNAYINWCAKFAESLQIGVPWIMCQEADAPEPMINTCNGWYCDSFEPNSKNVPKMWTENWTGWFKNWGGKVPHRTAEDLAYSVARFFQRGGTFQNYYMYHGGTNFGRSAGAYYTTSYDYDAPLDEYGNLNQPKWGHLKQLHLILKSMEKVLTYGNVSTTHFDHSVTATMYTYNGTSSCFLSNANSTSNSTITFQGSQYEIPAWSVSILPDCKNEVYSTAKVNTETTVMVIKSEDETISTSGFDWVWRPEQVKDATILGKGTSSFKGILEQKAASNDSSDYLWYMTSIDLDENDPILSDSMTLRVNTSGHVLHAFVNGKHIGSKWADHGHYKFVYEEKVHMRAGKNQISLLSVTVGLENYGPKYDMATTGIASVELISQMKNDETIVKNLASSNWEYRVGLHGEDKHIYDVESPHSARWHGTNVPSKRMMTWYKTTFKAPLGLDSVVVDLQGMGKGYAWVNGKSIGRYWPTFLAGDDGCSETCDYRGAYDNNKCVTNCGEPSQRWYHVPRSFLRDDMNVLVLFEEMGGDPSHINFQTVRVGSVCGNAYEGNTLELSCHGNGRTFSAVKFASFGNPQGQCGSFKKGSCDEPALSIVEKACLGKESCSINVSEQNFGTTSCGDITKRLAVELVC